MIITRASPVPNMPPLGRLIHPSPAHRLILRVMPYHLIPSPLHIHRQHILPLGLYPGLYVITFPKISRSWLTFRSSRLITPDHLGPISETGSLDPPAPDPAVCGHSSIRSGRAITIIITRIECRSMNVMSVPSAVCDYPRAAAMATRKLEKRTSAAASKVLHIPAAHHPRGPVPSRNLLT
jgi:hypothetical protein